MLRIVRELRPTWVFGENVAGIVSMALDDILSDLEGAEYQARAFNIPIGGVEAPHERQRIFIIAHSDKGRCDIEFGGREGIYRKPALPENRAGNQQNSDNQSKRTRGISTRSRVKRKGEVDNTGINPILTDSNQPGSQRYREPGERACKCTSRPGAWEESWIEVATRLCRVDARISHRVDRIECLGNSVSPQQVYPILKAIADIERG
jgi:DNA (cytosine-5)-methyltransferase 1